MKRQLLLLATLLYIGITYANAQKRVISSKEITYYNDIEINISAGTFTELIGGLAFSLNGIGDWSSNDYEISSDYRVFPALNLSYGRQLTPLINLGIILGYSQVSSDIIATSNNTKVGYSILAGAAIVPTVRFDWLRLDIVRCYSRAGIGVGYYIDRERYNDSSKKDNNNDVIGPNFDLVPFGIAIGRKLYGFCEVSIGTIGLAKAGIGYRF